MKSYPGILRQSKHDFDYIEPFRQDPFFIRALDINNVPYSPTLRQRMNQIAKVEDIELEKVIALYYEHGTCEQFHSELKMDLDLERFPLKRFCTKDLILHLGCTAYNLLRIIGQESLKEEDAPLKKKVIRRRVKTVIQNLMTLVSKMVSHARRLYLKFGTHSPWFPIFKRIYLCFLI
jgi:hypothetical protein